LYACAASLKDTDPRRVNSYRSNQAWHFILMPSTSICDEESARIVKRVWKGIRGNPAGILTLMVNSCHCGPS